MFRTMKRFRIGDIIIILFTILFILDLLYQDYVVSPAGNQVSITGKSFNARYPLDQDRIIDVDGPLGVEKIAIEDGEVWVLDTPCKQKICVKMGRIKRVGEQIICLPNRIFIEVDGDNGTIDDVSR